MQPGDVFHFFVSWTNPPKNKFVVCIDPDLELFFFINSRPQRRGHPGVDVWPSEVPCLAHKSFIHTTQLMRLYPTEAEQAAGARGSLPPAVRQRVKEAVQHHGQLPSAYMRLVLTNL